MMEWILSACVLTAAVIGLRYALGGRIDPRLQYALWALVLVRLLIPVNFRVGPFSVGSAVPTLAASTSVGGFCRRGYHRPQHSDRRPSTGRLPGGRRPSQYPPPSPSPLGEEGQGLPTLSLNQGLTPALAGGDGSGRPVVGRVQPPALPGSSGGPASRWRWRGPATRLRHPGRGVPLSLRPGPSGHLPAPKDFGGPRGPALRRGHETTHFRHGDPIWTLLRGVCVALHWYNPLVWWGAVLSRRDGESACDEATIRTLGEGGAGGLRPHPAPPDLWETLPPLHRRHHHGAAPGPSGERITRIAQRTRRKAGITVAVLALVAVAAGCTFPGSAPAAPSPSSGSLTARCRRPWQF